MWLPRQPTCVGKRFIPSSAADVQVEVDTLSTCTPVSAFSDQAAGLIGLSRIPSRIGIRLLVHFDLPMRC